jgi:selenocysteine lyase/cysteine desulfurase
MIGDRSLFPTLRARSYLAHCAISPLSRPVVDAMAAYTADFAAEGVSALGPWLGRRAALRGALASLIGARPDDVALVASTTAGVIDLAFAIPWRSGDRVVVFDGEFPTNVTPWQQAASTFGLEVVRLPLSGFGDGSGAGLGRVEDALKRGVRVVAVSAVQFQTGLAMPSNALGQLCRRYDAELFVDAIQAVGSVPVDVRHVDYLVAGSHKWLMGTDGCALLYVSPERVGALVPRLAGWLSHEDPVGFLFGGALTYDRPMRARADVFEVGATNGAGLAGLAAAVELLAGIGVAPIFAHIQAWHDAIEPGLRARGFTSLRASDPAARSGILALRTPLDVQALVRALGARGIVVSAPENCLRIAPHWPNALAEVPGVLASFDEAIADISAA